MNSGRHPNDVLFSGERQLATVSSCDHYAGSERLLLKALQLQKEREGQFDVTADCEDGAKTGNEREHMQMVLHLLHSTENVYRRLGVRIHSYDHPRWQDDIDELVRDGGELTAHITIPKVTRVAQAAAMIAHIQKACTIHKIHRDIPIHVLIETLGALRDVWQIAALPQVRVLDFGLMDFVSSHQGAIPTAAMRSPGQFSHPLIVRAKTEVVAAALTHGVIPAHNVTLELKDAARTAEDARRARTEFGFLRMWSIHPAQIEPILASMKPDFADLRHAEAMLAAAQDADWAPIRLEGELQDRGTYRNAWRLVQQARIYGQPLLDQTVNRFFD